MGIIRKCLKNPARACTYLAYRLLAVFGRTDFKKFILLARSRTGSNLLLSYLNSHPRIFARGEICQNLRGRGCKKILASVFNRQPGHIQAAGFKLFYYHPLDATNSPLWQELLSMPDLHVIHLKRRNILKTLVSRKIAARQHVWQRASVRSRSEKSPAVRIGSAELQLGFLQTREWEVNAERMFAGHKLLNLYYEDLVADPQGTFRHVTDFLGLAYRSPRSRLKKQNPASIKELLANYDELKTVFSGSDWASFFEE
jgi:LPS sulfotransferase NodH